MNANTNVVTKDQALATVNYFSELLTTFNQVHAKFGHRQLETTFAKVVCNTWEMPDTVNLLTGDPQVDDHEDCTYERSVLAAWSKLSTNLKPFVQQALPVLSKIPNTERVLDTRAQDEVCDVLNRLIKIKSDKITAYEAMFGAASEFLQQVFANFDWRGFNKPDAHISYNDTINTMRKDLGLKARLQAQQKGVEIVIWSSTKNKRTGMVQFAHGMSVDLARAKTQNEWDRLMKSVIDGSVDERRALDSIKAKDRKLSETEVKLIGNIMAVTNLGQECEFKVVKDALVFGTHTPVPHDKLGYAVGIVNGMLDGFCEDRQGEKAVDAEQKQWHKDMKKESLYSIAKTWDDMMPLCLWLMTK